MLTKKYFYVIIYSENEVNNLENGITTTVRKRSERVTDDVVTEQMVTSLRTLMFAGVFYFADEIKEG